MGVINCICIKPNQSVKIEDLLEKMSDPKDSKKKIIEDIKPTNLNNIPDMQVTFNVNVNYSSELTKTKGRIKEKVTIKSIKSNDFDETDKPGVEISPSQVPYTLSEKVIEIERLLPKFELTLQEKSLIANPQLKKYTILYSDNKVYDCQFNKNWEKEGYGYMYFPNGSKFEGIFKEDRMLRGRLINAEGDYYEGKLITYLTIKVNLKMMLQMELEHT